jgi:hypothetical protein
VSTDGDPGIPDLEIPESVYLLNCLDSATPRALTLATSWSGDRGSQKSGQGPPGPWAMLRQVGEGLGNGTTTQRAREALLDTQDR